ncbi:MAG TPA: nucleotide sugar dehydrogenase [Saprospiraceae bacterium]|nr:nucleotide sugar dehydrogenase [Saprospiraceae bacterium]HMX86065.1 nucleotide sugar dehydrogenase [Saprospiraceae bacterium]HNE66130.1 nucleotide sugar dehydrogenase [Saprospiraceae bacterium]HNG06813.1 nucleotide sugar dehydrogenase [Saprospiraceae bacterium]HNG13007.1 nucleotide sugar dehydrogenase [Saprospiraceae bacterium]
MFEDLVSKKKKISVTGLGYVGLPIALELARHFSVVGFDVNNDRVGLMKQGIDPSNELDASAFEGVDILFTSDAADLRQAHFHIIAVPTDIDEHKVPNLNPLKGASRSVGRGLKKGDYVVYESTVYPSCTEEDCLPVLEAESSLKLGTDFKLGYSPERIVPGDKEKTLTNILKIVSGSDEEALEEIAKVYGHVIKAGVYKAPSIKVAEAAKVIENTQRDLNISLMNELSIIFDKMGIDTGEVIKAAGTKWNFIKLYPGLVGGHCIGVDPYYLLHKARELSVEPQVIAAGRRINDGMPAWIAKKLVQMLISKGKNPGQCKVLMMGVTFKENVSDIRNSKVVNLIHELMQYSVVVHVVDPHASHNDVAHEYKLVMTENISSDYDAVVVTVGHGEYRSLDEQYFKSIMKENAILMDIKGIYNFDATDFTYWKL